MRIILRKVYNKVPEIALEWDDKFIEPRFASHLLTHLYSEVLPSGKILWHWDNFLKCDDCGAEFIPSEALLSNYAMMGITEVV